MKRHTYDWKQNSLHQKTRLNSRSSCRYIYKPETNIMFRYNLNTKFGRFATKLKLARRMLRMFTQHIDIILNCLLPSYPTIKYENNTMLGESLNDVYFLEKSKSSGDQINKRVTKL